MSHPTTDTFTHLHLHTVNSLLDGAIRIKDLMSHLKAHGMTAVAMTDHGNMFGTIDFYLAAKAAGIKPIIGCEVYIAPGSRFEKAEAKKIADGGNYHLVLLAKNKTGYKNLIKLVSRGYTEGFYFKPRIDYELLAENSAGLIATTACLGGEVNRLIYEGEMKKAATLAGRLNEILGQGNFFLEIQNHGLPEQLEVACGAVSLHKKLGIPLVLTNDAHFLKREDQKAQEIMLRIQLGKKIKDPLQFGFNEEFYVKSPAEMKMLFPELPEAFYNTNLIAEMCELDLEMGHPLLPDFKTPNGKSLAAYLDEVAEEGLRQRFAGLSEIPTHYLSRLRYELSVIHEMGFDGYFLIVWDFIHYARQKGIPVGPGRGSAAGSLVAFALGITNIDPLKYNLLFERFLNPQRKELPDIDIDFCRERREEVIQYVTQNYGADKVCQIITFGTLSAKAVIKDVARVLDIDFAYINSLTRNLPSAPGIKLSEALKQAPEIQEFFEKDERGQMLYQVALTLEGNPRNASKHAAGVVISPVPLEEIVPLARETGNGAIITQFEKSALEKVGLVKMDFLGLKNLTILDNCIREIKKRHGIDITLDNLSLEDEKVYRLLQEGETKGVFQVESPGLTRLLMEAKPRAFEDIVACIALYRPGPIKSGMTESYVQRRNGLAKIEYPHKVLEPILKDTLGTLVYQEQIMLISQIIAGFTPAEADNLRKAMGKKLLDKMSQMKEKFLQGAQAKGYDVKWASKLFEDMSKFAEYGFNKSHSAAYALITYQTAWFKANYPVEFMKASLDADIETTDKLIGFIKACRDMSIAILPPDVNESDMFFTITGGRVIRYGLLGIKGLGEPAVKALLQARGDKPFKDMGDLVSRLEPKFCNKKFLEALILSGACDSFGFSRAALFDAIEDILAFGARVYQDLSVGQGALFASESQLTRLHLVNKPEWPEHLRLAKEKETLGLYLSAHPLDQYSRLMRLANITPLAALDDGQSEERNLTVMGIVEEVKTVNSKRGTFTRLRISDNTEVADIRVYSNLYDKVKPYLKEGNIIVADLKINILRNEENPLIFATAVNIVGVELLQERVSKSLHIYLGKTTSQELIPYIRQVKKVLLNCRGEWPVFLYYYNALGERQVVQVHPQFYVKYCPEVDNLLSKVLPQDGDFAWRVGDEVRTNRRSLVVTLPA